MLATLIISPVLRALALTSCLMAAGPGIAQEIQTDANIVTGLDVSYSVEPDVRRLALVGMADAVRTPEVVDAIARGRHGRIGFAVFAWHHGQFPIVASWSLIETKTDARAIGATIGKRLEVNVDLEARQGTKYYVGRLTDVSKAIDHAAEMLSHAPYAADRRIINIVGNGKDNVGEDAGAARDRVVERGGTVNGVVLTSDPIGLAYYGREVIGGPGAFLLSLNDAGTMVEVLTRKFLRDLVVAGNDIGGAP